MDDVKAQIKGLEKDINVYKALAKINRSDELNAFIDLVLKTVTAKILYAFTTDTIKTFDQFLELRGEIRSYLYPIQEVRGSTAAADALTKQLNDYYKNPNQQ